MLSLDEWDVNYLRTLATRSADETPFLEKKAAAFFDARPSELKEEITKQVCAFANASGGFIVFGIADSGGLDEGIPEQKGNKPVKDWIEGLIPSQDIRPQITGCRARFLHDPTHHKPNRGVLTIWVPPSEARPHWIRSGTRETPYLRVGSHSAPMSLQTFQDISSRGSSGVPEIEGLDSWNIRETPAAAREYFFNPRVTLLSGPMCESWLFTLKGHPEVVWLLPDGAKNVHIRDTHEIALHAYEPLYPGGSTPVGNGPLKIVARQNWGDMDEIVATIHAGASRPVSKKFRLIDLVLKARSSPMR